jgi:hypothetical protein
VTRQMPQPWAPNAKVTIHAAKFERTVCDRRAPAELRRRPERVPTGDDLFPWRPNETVFGPTPRRDGFWARLAALYGPSSLKDSNR